MSTESKCKGGSLLHNFCWFIGGAFIALAVCIALNYLTLNRQSERIADQYREMSLAHSEKLVQMHRRDFYPADYKHPLPPAVTDKGLQQSIACDTATLRYETTLMTHRTEELLRNHLATVEANYNHILIWVGVLTLLFLVFSFFGLFKIEDTIKRAKEALDNSKAIFNSADQILRETQNNVDQTLKTVQDQADQTIQAVQADGMTAIEALKKETKKSTEIFKLQWQLSDAKKFYSDKDYNKAIEAFTESIRSIENAPIEQNDKNNLLTEAYNGRGMAQDDAGNYAEAINDYNKVIEIDPKDARAFNNRGVSHNNLKEYEKAVKDYTETIGINPQSTEAYNNRGNTYSDLGKHDQALEDYKKAIEINPQYATAYNNRGNTYSDLGKHDQALEDYKKAIEINPQYATAYNNRGNTYNELKRYDEALKDYNKAVEINPLYAEAYYNKAVLLAQVATKGKHSKIGFTSAEQCTREALQNIEKALNITPDNEQFKELKGNIESLLKELSEGTAPQGGEEGPAPGE